MPQQTPPTLRQYTPPQALLLANGQRLPAATIGYQTWGELNVASDNVIWVCHALTGSSDVESWWAGVFGAGKSLDPARDFIVCANTLGSCYGSAGPDSIDPTTGARYAASFPEVQIGDIVEHQRLLADHLGVREIQLVIGASMGGFQALEWARREPQRVRRVALVASSWRQPPQALAQARLQCEFIRRDGKFQGGNYLPGEGPDEGLALARQLGHLTYRSPVELDLRFGRERRADGHWQVLSYLDHQGEKLVRRFDALCYVRLTEAMNRYDFAAGGDSALALAAIRQPALVVSIDTDQLYFPSEQQRLAQQLPNARLVTLRSDFGHDGFLVDAAKLDPALLAFRHQARPRLLAPHTAAINAAAPANAQSRIPLIVIGATGRVGGEVLRLLDRASARVPAKLVAVANSRAAVWQSEGIAFLSAADRLAASPNSSAEALIAQLIRAGRPGLLVDCTASPRIAAFTARLLEAGIAVVTPNKIAFAAPGIEYAALRRALAGNTPGAWSATVGAGLPILSTIQRLVAAGDSLTEVEAGLSGTLGYLLTRTHDGQGLVQALGEAIEQGLAEPDPRGDLSGEDVRRKLSIILRAAGIDTEPAQIALNPLLTLEHQGDWRHALIAHEPTFAQQIDAAKRARLRLVYRARWSSERGAEVGPALVAQDHPLAGARGAENRVILRTRFQGVQPIVIAGAGAGVRITAAAVLADVCGVLERLTQHRGPRVLVGSNRAPGREQWSKLHATRAKATA